jgi:hypothetical protein
MQERFESTAVGRGIISLFLVMTLVSVVTWNLPSSELKAETVGVIAPYVNATGLNQNWSVFAPEPRRSTIVLEARITYADGTRETWQPPDRNAVVGGYSDYRWRKWYEHVMSGDETFLWKPAAEYVARLHTREGRQPVRVVLIRRSQALLAPGPGPERGEWTETTLYTLIVRP